MPSSDNFGRNLALGVSAAALAGAALLLYSKSQELKGESAAKKSWSPDAVDTETMSNLLTEIVDSQNKMKKVMETLAKTILDKDLSFAEICEEVRGMKIPDPLTERGISIDQFSQLLAVHNTNQDIRAKILQLTGSPMEVKGTPVKGEELEKLVKLHSIEKVIDIHAYMLDELTAVLGSVNKRIEPRVATISAQAFVGKQVKTKFGLSSEGLEALAAEYHYQLSQDQRFFELGTEIRQTIQNLVMKCGTFQE